MTTYSVFPRLPAALHICSRRLDAGIWMLVFASDWKVGPFKMRNFEKKSSLMQKFYVNILIDKKNRYSYRVASSKTVQSQTLQWTLWFTLCIHRLERRSTNLGTITFAIKETEKVYLLFACEVCVRVTTKETPCRTNDQPLSFLFIVFQD